MTKTEMRKEIRAILNADRALLANVVEEIDDIVDFLGDDRWTDMSTLNLVLGDINPLDVAMMCYWGKDLDSWNDRPTFNPTRKYFRFDAYGHLESSDVRDYSDWNDSCLADNIARYWGRLDSVKSDKELLNLAIALDEAED